MLTDILVQYGFSLKEAEIYLANLSMGSSPASSIARKVNENRVTVYSILKKLVSEGIAHTVTKKNTTFYTVISPEQLLKNLEEKYARFKEKLPELNAIASVGGSKPKVQFFEGFEGLKQLYMETLDASTDGESFLGDSSMPTEVMERLDTVYVPLRVKAGLKYRVIVANKAQGKYYYKATSKDLIAKKHIPGLSFGVKGEIMLFGPGKVAISMDQQDEMAGLLIHSQQLYETMRNIFDFIRNGADESTLRNPMKPTNSG